jgi:hypothetical protein
MDGFLHDSSARMERRYLVALLGLRHVAPADEAGLSAEVGKPRNRFVRGPKGVGQEPEVDQRRLNTVAFLVRRAAEATNG